MIGSPPHTLLDEDHDLRPGNVLWRPGLFSRSTRPMPRRRKDRKAIDQGDWGACIAWRRMYVAILNSGWDLRIPVALLLNDSRYIHQYDSRLKRQAVDKLRMAWRAFADGSEWNAIVDCIWARVLAGGEVRPDLHEQEGFALCVIFREAYPTAPSGFERVGRLADGKDDR